LLISSVLRHAVNAEDKGLSANAVLAFKKNIIIIRKTFWDRLGPGHNDFVSDLVVYVSVGVPLS